MKWIAYLLTWRPSLSLALALVVLFKTSTHRLQNSQVTLRLLFCLFCILKNRANFPHSCLLCSISGVHSLLRKLQFLFELPARLNKCLELQAYAQAVKSYRHARCVLQQYSHLPSFKGIQDDCHAIMNKLAQELRQKFRSVSL